MRTMLAAMVWCAAASAVHGQSSSLYVPQNVGPERQPLSTGGAAAASPLSPAVSAASLAAVKLPEPRTYAVQDLVTIVVRESAQSDSDAILETKKEGKVEGGVTKWPNMALNELLQFHFAGGPLANPPRVAADSKQEFKGDGTYSRKDSVTTRITARIIDIKPNGNLVLEARKNIKTDGETLEMVLTGVCRKDDVAIDNTILSTQLADLHLNKHHSGELKGATQKGIITQVIEFLFNF